MKEKIKKLKIPLLVIFVLLIIAVIMLLFFNQNKNYQNQENQKISQLEQQVKNLTPGQKIIKGPIKYTITGLPSQNNNSSQAAQSSDITATDINPYLTGVYQIICDNVSGSGSLWNIAGDYYVLTNHHVITSPDPDGRCDVEFYDSKNSNNLTNWYEVYPQQSDSAWNNSTDVALLKLFPETAVNLSWSVPPISALNYKISSLPKCPNLAIGSPVVVLGYPAFGMTQVNIQDLSGVQATLIMTNGVISGYDSSDQKPIGNLPYPNYFVSATIDSGNSGGIAISKSFQGLCVLGIPTWISLGNYQTQGVIQNINNVMYTGK